MYDNGNGPLVSGPADALMLAITGRPDALRDLTGDGVDALTSGVGDAVTGASRRIRGWQNGYVRSYALSMFAGTTVIVALVMAVNVL